MRISRAQYDLLENISWYPQGRPFRTLHFSYAPMRRLIKKGAIEKGTARKDGWATYRITTAGRAALQEKDNQP